MKRWVLALFLAFVLAACSDRAAEMYETAQFEELQRNYAHALKLYRDIVAAHPQSPHAEKARERIAELEAREP